MSRQEITKLNPFTQDVLYTHPKNSMIDMVKIIQFANKFFLDWKKTTINDRLLLLEKIIEQYILKKDKIVFSEAWDQGLPFDFTTRANYEIGLKLLLQFKKQLEEYIKSETTISFSPNGVVAVILSWNLSNRLFIQNALSACLAGNTVVVKVSSVAMSLIGIWQDLLKSAGWPEHVIQFVVTNEDDGKKLLVSHPGIKAVMATGSLNTCAQIFKNQSTMAEKQFKKIHLASGAKNSCIVLDQPQPELVDQVLESFLLGQGQLVWNSARLFILEKYQSMWIESITETFKNLKPAENPSDNSPWGPMIKSNGEFSYDELKTLAEKDQAKFISTNQNMKHKNYLAPLFTYDMSNCSELQQDELRLPIFVLSAVKYGFDIPKYSNVSYYGHSANLFSKESSWDKITSQLDVGRVSLNQWSIYSDLPYAVVKQSAQGLQNHQIFGDFNSNVKTIA